MPGEPNRHYGRHSLTSDAQSLKVVQTLGHLWSMGADCETRISQLESALWWTPLQSFEFFKYLAGINAWDFAWQFGQKLYTMPPISSLEKVGLLTFDEEQCEHCEQIVLVPIPSFTWSIRNNQNLILGSMWHGNVCGTLYVTCNVLLSWESGGTNFAADHQPSLPMVPLQASSASVLTWDGKSQMILVSIPLRASTLTCSTAILRQFGWYWNTVGSKQEYGAFIIGLTLLTLRALTTSFPLQWVIDFPLLTKSSCGAYGMALFIIISRKLALILPTMAFVNGVGFLMDMNIVPSTVQLSSQSECNFLIVRSSGITCPCLLLIMDLSVRIPTVLSFGPGFLTMRVQLLGTHVQLMMGCNTSSRTALCILVLRQEWDFLHGLASWRIIPRSLQLMFFPDYLRPLTDVSCMRFGRHFDGVFNIHVLLPSGRIVPLCTSIFSICRNFNKCPPIGPVKIFGTRFQHFFRLLVHHQGFTRWRLTELWAQRLMKRMHGKSGTTEQQMVQRKLHCDFYLMTN